MKWVLFDYGVGNLHSLRKALIAAGADAHITPDWHEFVEADVAVLPGVGAFGAVMERLAPAKSALQRRHRQGKPILGVCIGMQVLHESSDESPGVPGLGILEGRVRRLPDTEGKVPHMGWNILEPVTAGVAPSALLAGVPPASHVYYVHSFALVPDRYTLATSRHGMPFAAALRAGNTVAFQFHPEKSSAVGATLLRNTVRELEAA